MKKNDVLCVIYDRISGIHTAPMLYSNLECAKRHFKRLTKGDNILPTDYELYKIGTYDDCLGEIDLLPKKEFIMIGELNEE